MKMKILSDKAPAAIGPYSQGIRIDNLLFVSGQIPMDPATNEMEPGGFREQTRRVLSNLIGLLSDQGLNAGNVLKTSVFLKNMDDFGALNEEYAKVFNADPPPARECVEVAGLPRDALVEISLIAYFPKDE